MEFDIPLWLIGLMKLMLISCHQTSIQGLESTQAILFGPNEQTETNIGFGSDNVQTDIFQTWYDDGHYLTLLFDLDLYLWSVSLGFIQS